MGAFIGLIFACITNIFTIIFLGLLGSWFFLDVLPWLFFAILPYLCMAAVGFVLFLFYRKNKSACHDFANNMFLKLKEKFVSSEYYKNK